MKVKDRIYYTGDMANCGDFGEITAVYSNKWGDFCDILWEIYSDKNLEKIAKEKGLII